MTEFEELVDACYQPLYHFAFSLAKDADRAADLVERSCVIWARKERELQGGSKAGSGLFTTLYREHLGQACGESRVPLRGLSEAERSSPVPGPETKGQMEAKRTVELLGGLDQTLRAPLALFYLQHHSYKEIAAILDIPIGTVMSRISRGKEQFRHRILKESAAAPEKVDEPQPDALKESDG